MSQHNERNATLDAALIAHKLPHDTPSQLSDAFRIGWQAAQTTFQDAEPVDIGYMQKVSEALYENGDPVSIDAAELLERVSTVTTQWQLIETAPHGKVILGFIPHSMGGYVCPTLRIELGSWNNASCAAFSEVNPTHWMPLPKPPIAAAVNAFNGVKP
ncbi:DUF551 domain-containing protein [Polynucleobacter sp.]|uniref:DUF551 domain-containing protein n=1 Tax=Polynucleobacter sp. TaxID=2029855 RepID=UPI003F6A0F5D